MDPCVHFACHNGGKCSAPADRPYCTCPPGFSGVHCEVKEVARDPCVHYACHNGGSCSAPADKPICTCPCGVSGVHCEIKDDPCGGCPPGEVCQPTRIMCVTTPCPTHRCMTVTPPDPCGGCPPGEVCQPTRIMCVTTPCATHRCMTVTPPDPCGGTCAPGKTCQMLYPPCPAPPDCREWEQLNPGVPCPKVVCDPIPTCT